MIKRKNKEEVFISKSSKVLKILCTLVGIILSLVYCINGGFYSLLFDLRESKTVIVYSILIIILLFLLVFLNASEETEIENEKKFEKSSFVTIGIIVLIILFGLLLVITLLDFFLPLIVITACLILTYYLVLKLIKAIVKKYGIK